MFRIVKKEVLSPKITLLEIEAPFIARKAQPGQFIILRIDEKGERIPLTIGGYDRDKGTVTIIFQRAGLTTYALAALDEGDALMDFVGPLGNPTEMDGVKKACVVGGGVGCAIAYPIAHGLHDAGVETDVIIGFRSKDFVILEDGFRAAARKLYLLTEDGSQGEKGQVIDKLKELLTAGEKYDKIYTLGPVPMMKNVYKTAEPFGVETIVSLCPIMIDGTGMCGGCRVTVGGEMKFACVDGPDFNGAEVDFDELINRLATFKEQETKKQEDHACRFEKLGKDLIK